MPGIRTEKWAGELAQRLKALTALPEDPSSVPSNHTRLLTMACTTTLRGSDAFLWPLWACAHMSNYEYMHTHIRKKQQQKIM